MLADYNKIKEGLGGLEKSIQESRKSLAEHLSTSKNMKELKDKTERQEEREISEHILVMKEEHTERIQRVYEAHLQTLIKHRSKVNGEFLILSQYIDSYGFIDNENYHKKVEAMRGTMSGLDTYLQPVMSEGLLTMYDDYGYGDKLNEMTINKFKKWLEYFDNYDVHDGVMGKAVSVEKLLSDKVETSYILLIIIFILSIMVQYRILTIAPYLIFILLTMYLRGRKFYSILSLLGIYSKTDKTIGELEESNRELLEEHADYYTKITERELLKHQEEIREIEEGIKREKEKAVKEALTSFDEDKAREEAKKMVKTDTENMENLIEAEDAKVEEYSNKIKELQEKLNEDKEELIRIKEKIREVYQNLIPSFKSFNMLDSFFLGFKDDEPVTFDYNGKPALIFYDSQTGELDAVMTTIKMMCGQIMTTLNPLAYVINVVDSLTGGASLSSFQVTGDNEDDLYQSPLFKVAGTVRESNILTEHLFREYNSRRIKVLGSHNSIREYNAKKIAERARTLKYEICFFYEYDYKILEEELMRQLSRVAHNIGFCLFFMVDISKIEPPGKKEDREDKENVRELHQYQTDTLMRIFSLFKEGNIYGFNVREDDIDIVEVSQDKVMKDLIKKRGR